MTRAKYVEEEEEEPEEEDAPDAELSKQPYYIVQALQTTLNLA